MPEVPQVSKVFEGEKRSTKFVKEYLREVLRRPRRREDTLAQNLSRKTSPSHADTADFA